MKWMVHLHPGLAAMLMGEGGPSRPENPASDPDAANDPALILAALFHIEENGLYEAPLTRLWLKEFFPGDLILPGAIAFYQLTDPRRIDPPVLLAVECHALDPDITILATNTRILPRNAERNTAQSPEKNAALLPHDTAQTAAFLAQVLARFEDLAMEGKPRKCLQDSVIPHLPPALIAAARAVQDGWLRQAEITARYAAALRSTRDDIAALFNITDARVQRIEKRFTYILETLRRNLQHHGATCRIQIVFSDGKTLSGDDLDAVK